MYQNPYFQFGPQYQSPVPVNRPFIQNIPVVQRSIYQGVHVPNPYVQNQQLFQGLQQDQTPYIQTHQNLVQTTHQNLVQTCQTPSKLVQAL